LLNKVPEVTLYFWVVKVLCTTVGETAADYLDGHLGWGLPDTTLVVGALLAAALGWQLSTRRYVAGVYWTVVVLTSVTGTLLSDNLTRSLGVPVPATTAVLAVCLVTTFVVWFAKERTLSIHSIVTARREGFYWLAILLTFALGTSAGDLVSERLSLGYLAAVAGFAGCVALVASAHWWFGLPAVPAFWTAYVLTRPLGASFGDYLSQPSKGLGLGSTGTSALFLAAILPLVAYLAATRADVERI
jgi:uncharacterized membrane-anchored protein